MKIPLCTGFDTPLGLDRRHFLKTFGMGFGGLALADMIHAAERSSAPISGIAGPTAKAKRVIYLFQAGAPSQIDLFDYKPRLIKDHGKELPDSVRQGQRLTGMSGNQASLPIAGSPFEFEQHGASGAWISDLLPHTAKIADDLCFIRIHAHRGHQPRPRRSPSADRLPDPRPPQHRRVARSTASAAMNADLPAFVVLVSKNKSGQPLFSRLWGSGFLPANTRACNSAPARTRCST